MAQKHEVAILPWSPLWGGLLTGKYRRDQPLPPDSRLTFDPLTGFWESNLGPQFYDLLDLLEELAAAKNCTIPQLVLAWTISQPAITSAIIGPRTLAQLQDNLGAIEVEINDDDRQRIDALAPPGGALAKLPNQ